MKNKKSISTICIGMIIILGGLGTSYAAWNDNIDINHKFIMGEMDIKIEPDKYIENQNLKIEIYENSMEIQAQMELNSSMEIPFSVIDIGTVSSELYSIEEIENTSSEVVSLNYLSNYSEDTVEPFRFSLDATESLDYTESVNTEFNSLKELEDAIFNLEQDIEEYQKFTKKYEFEYKLIFQQKQYQNH